MNSPLLTPSEVATMLAVKPSWVYEACRGDRLPHVRIGRHLRFRAIDIEAWVAGQLKARTTH